MHPAAKSFRDAHDHHSCRRQPDASSNHLTPMLACVTKMDLTYLIGQRITVAMLCKRFDMARETAGVTEQYIRNRKGKKVSPTK